MQLRSIQIIIPSALAQEIKETLDAFETAEFRESDIGSTKKSITFFAKAERTKELLKNFETRFSSVAGFRIIISAVEATIPAFSDEELPDEEAGEQETTTAFHRTKLLRIPHQELYSTVLQGATISPNFVIMFILSAIVAGIGLLQNNVSIIIGSMVIAPFLGPNVALALGTTLGDKELIRKSSRLLLLGTCLVFCFSLLWGLVDSSVAVLVDTPAISYYLIIVAFVSGVAAILSLMKGESSTLVGVMVAVALLPPLVMTGLLVGGGFFIPAFHAFMLFAANVICLNLAGVLMFWIAGVKPIKRWEEGKAKKHTKRALRIWTVLLAILIVITAYLTQ